MKRVITLILLMLIFTACTRISIPSEAPNKTVKEEIQINKTIPEPVAEETPQEVVDQTIKDTEVEDFGDVI
jgi:PBP1b-binding outer membrane lipoprotein LpoB